MAEGPSFRPYRGRPEQPHLEARLKVIEQSLLRITQAPPLDTPGGVQSFPVQPQGGGGGGTPPPSDPNAYLAGDCVGPVLSNTVEGLWTLPLTQPASPGDDQKFIYYDDASGTWKLAIPAGTGPQVDRETYGVWARNNLTNAGTSKGEMPFVDLGGGKFYGVSMPFAGTIVGISLDLTGDVGGVGDAYEVEVYKDTGSGYAATGVKATVTGSAGTDRRAYSAAGAVAFAAGDVLTVYDQKTGTPNAEAAISYIIVKTSS